MWVGEGLLNRRMYLRIDEECVYGYRVHVITENTLHCQQTFRVEAQEFKDDRNI